MSRSARATGGALAIIALALGALAGCASSSPGASSSPSASASAPGAATAPVGAAWLDGGHGAALVSMGSSSCPPQAGEVTASGQTVTVDFPTATAAKPCTSDHAPRASYIALPSGVDATKDVQIVATGELSGTVKLAALASSPAAPGDNAPSAGWVEGAGGSDVSSGSFAFVTWGSSTCVPSVGSVSGTSAGSVTLQLAESPNTACTMDMVPRAGLAVVPETVTDSAVKVSFEGAGITGSTDMLGTR